MSFKKSIFAAEVISESFDPFRHVAQFDVEANVLHARIALFQFLKLLIFKFTIHLA